MMGQTEGHSTDINSLRKIRWLAVGVVIALTLGTVGYHRYEVAHGHEVSLWDSCFHAIQLLGLHTPHLEGPIPLTLEVARWIAVAMIFFAVFQVALHVLKIQWAILLSARRQDLVVICGLTRTSLEFIRYFRGKGRKGRRPVIVIDRAPAHDLRHTAQALGAHVVVGDATEVGVLEAAGVRFAHQVLAMLPDDAANLYVARQVVSLLGRGRKRKVPLDCRVQISDVELWSACKRSSLFADGPICRITPMDVYRASVKQLLIEDMPLDRISGIRRDDPRPPCLIILGFGKMGRLLAVRAARIAHYANGQKLRIIVVDRKAEENEKRLLFRYPAFREVCDIEFHNIEAESPELLRLLKANCDPDRCISSVAVCFQNATLAAEIALRIRPALQGVGTPLAVRFTRDENLAHLLQEVGGPTPTRGHHSVIAFGTVHDANVKRIFDVEAGDQVARQLHEDYVSQRRSDANPNPDDPSLAPWDRLCEDLKESNRQSADHIGVKLRAIGCVARPVAGDVGGSIDEPDVELLARMEHARWTAERLLAGWERGPKNVGLKLNPSIAPWSDLPDEIREYDRQFVRLIPTLLGRCGLKIVPMEKS